MRKLSLIALLVLFCGVAAVAQESKTEFYAGYSYLRVDCGDSCPYNGWPAGFNADATYYLTKGLGIATEFEYNHKGLDSLETGASAAGVGVHAGPRYKFRMGRFQPFVQGLFGFTHMRFTDPSLFLCGTTDCADNAFSMKMGGGLDVVVSRHFAMRLGEFNYYLTRFDGSATSTSPLAGALNEQTHQNNYTFSAGVVIR
jgi:opacity protein-like surface antigen